MFKIKKLEDFAVIERLEDELELKDLTIFMGDNSSGKSYLAMLIHSFFSNSYNNKLLSFINNDLEIIKKIKSTIDTLLETENSTISMDLNNQDIEELNAIIEDILKELTDDFFNSTLKDIKIEMRYDIDSINSPTFNYKIEKFNRIDFGIKTSYNEKRISFSNKNNPRDKILNFVLVSMIENILSKFHYSSIYLPASRTGYLQTYNILANQAINSSYSYEEQKIYNPLSETIRKFISLLNYSTDFEENEFANYIENFILKGKVDIYKNSNAIDFKLKDGKKIDINYLSSTVSELIPLVVFLKRGFIAEGILLVIEEPEAHLSFENQKMMAKLITMLINHGIKVLITTHSDFLIYELNNLIMKDTISKNKELFRDDIKLDFNRVGLYNFLLKDNGRSTVSRVDIDKYGIDNGYIFDNTYNMVNEKDKLLDLMDAIDGTDSE
jgi:predicted ATPase